jgi:hypothetical protein
VPNYQLWLCNDNYTRSALLANSGTARSWAKLSYRQAINDLEGASVDLVPNSSKVASATLMKRLLIYRDGVIVFGGLLEREEWAIGGSAPDGDTWTIHARSACEYASWRLATPGSGDEYDSRTGALDDLAKEYVAYHLGASAAAARQFSDLSIEADATAAASTTIEARYDVLLTLLQKLAKQGGFDWRFVPSATGVEFQTEYPQWGLDRTKGNGVNDEMVFSLDRRNFSRMTYAQDLLGHYNYLYVGGQGEGADREIVERSTAGDITAYKRRERFYNGSRYSLTASLEAAGDVELAKLAASEVMTVKPLPGVWPAQFGLGDLVTMFVVRYGRTFTQDAKVTAIGVTVDPEGIEDVTPELEAV